MPHSGPYTTIVWEERRKVLDLRKDWWAVEADLIDTPDVKRIIMNDLWCQLGGDTELIAQRIVDNELDTSLDFRPGILPSIIEQNPAVTSHTGDEPPYGYLDWWPNSLWVNTLLPPYDDARVRRAMSLAIDRDTIDDVVYEGSQVTTVFPFPLYPGLKSFVAREDVQALIERYESMPPSMVLTPSTATSPL
jgi:ABC-type transport system substrate-binding protein